jgi:hypothetical protein
LKEENFPHLREAKIKSADANHSSSATSPASPEINLHHEDPETSSAGEPSKRPKDDDGDIEKGDTVDASTKFMDEDLLFIEVPTPGFQFASSATRVGHLTQRSVPNVCSICLCNYYPGNNVVWSSNDACDHVFHEQCILQWIMKQREGPLCPCCRRDFVLDPYDMEDEDMDPAAVGISLEITEGPAGHEDDSSASEEEGLAAPVHPPSNNTGNDSDRIIPIVDAVAAAQEAALAMHMEEGLSSSSSSHSSRRMDEESSETAVRLQGGGSGD